MNDRFGISRAGALGAERASSSVTVIDSNARKVLRNTYMLLSVCLGFAAVTAGTSAALGLPHPGILLTLVGYFGLFFLISKYRDSGAGLALTFALTGFMGYTLGPVISHYLNMPNGTLTVMTALGGTAVTFLGMSTYAMVTKRDLSGMGSFLAVGVLVAFLASLAAVFLEIPALSLTISAVFVLLMSGMILWETNNIVRGGETNYVMATLSLFVSIFNLFTSLLHLLGFANKE